MPPGSSDYARQLADARRQDRKMARRNRRAVDAGKYWTAKSRTRQRLKSFSARLIAAEHVSRRHRRQRREPLTEEQRRALVRRLLTSGPVEDPVYAFEQPSRTTREGRILFAFGDLRIA